MRPHLHHEPLRPLLCLCVILPLTRGVSPPGGKGTQYLMIFLFVSKEDMHSHLPGSLPSISLPPTLPRSHPPARLLSIGHGGGRQQKARSPYTPHSMPCSTLVCSRLCVRWAPSTCLSSLIAALSPGRSEGALGEGLAGRFPKNPPSGSLPFSEIPSE